MGSYNLKSFNEQTNFLKMLSGKLIIPNVNLHNDDYFRCFAIYYTQRSFDEKSMNFLNEQLGEYILTGQLDNWLKDNKEYIKQLPDIHFFWHDYCNCAQYFNINVPTGFTDEELGQLEASSNHAIMGNLGFDDNNEDEKDIDLFKDQLSPMSFLCAQHAYEDAKMQEYIRKHNLKEEETWLSRLCRDLRVINRLY